MRLPVLFVRSGALTAALAASPLLTQETRPEPRTLQKAAGFDIEVIGELKGFALDARTQRLAEGLEVLALKLTSPQPLPPPKLTLRWSVPSHDLAGHWMTGRHLNKTIRPDWAGSRLQPSMFAREAPVSALFTSDNRNLLTFAWSDALNTVLIGSGVREEDGLIYILFSVPQVSVRLQEIPKDHLEMVRFYTGYWNDNRAVLLDGEIEAPFPAANYPVVVGTARGREKQIIGVYGDVFVSLNDGGRRPPPRIDVVNAKSSETVILSVAQPLGTYRYVVRDCQGRIVKRDQVRLDKGAHELTVPPSGLVALERQ